MWYIIQHPKHSFCLLLYFINCIESVQKPCRGLKSIMNLAEFAFSNPGPTGPRLSFFIPHIIPCCLPLPLTHSLLPSRVGHLQFFSCLFHSFADRHCPVLFPVTAVRLCQVGETIWKSGYTSLSLSLSIAVSRIQINTARASCITQLSYILLSLSFILHSPARHWHTRSSFKLESICYNSPSP